MDWFLWLLVGWWVFSAVMTTAWVGRRREPIDGVTAAIMVLLDAGLIAGLLVTR